MHPFHMVPPRSFLAKCGGASLSRIRLYPVVCQFVLFDVVVEGEAPIITDGALVACFRLLFFVAFQACVGGGVSFRDEKEELE